MATTNTLIDVKRGNLTMTVLGETAKFSIFNKTPTSNNALSNNCSFIDCIDLAVESVFLQEHIDFESVDTVEDKEFCKEEKQKWNGQREKPYDEETMPDQT